MHDEAPKVRLRLHAAQLDEVERGLVEGRLLVGIVPVYQRREEFDYFDLYHELSHAYCASGHPLFEANDADIDVETLRRYEVVNHRYAIHRDKAAFVNYDSQSASASQVEAVSMMILTGRFIGFLPEHFAAQLVRDGRLRVLRPDLIRISTQFNLILRHNAPRSPLVKAFAQAMGVELKAAI
jgi:DNA-binding transcriptional LysR family regulator